MIRRGSGKTPSATRAGCGTATIATESRKKHGGTHTRVSILDQPASQQRKPRTCSSSTLCISSSSLSRSSCRRLSHSSVSPEVSPSASKNGLSELRCSRAGFGGVTFRVPPGLADGRGSLGIRRSVSAASPFPPRRTTKDDFFADEGGERSNVAEAGESDMGRNVVDGG